MWQFFVLNFKILYEIGQKYLRLENVPQDPISDLAYLVTYASIPNPMGPR